MQQERAGKQETPTGYEIFNNKTLKSWRMTQQGLKPAFIERRFRPG